MAIEYGKLSDRELLILTVQTCNTISERLNTLNGTTRNHEGRIIKLETEESIAGKALYAPSKKQIMGVGSFLVAIGTLAGAILSRIGSSVGWW